MKKPLGIFALLLLVALIINWFIVPYWQRKQGIKFLNANQATVLLVGEEALYTLDGSGQWKETSVNPQPGWTDCRQAIVSGTHLVYYVSDKRTIVIRDIQTKTIEKEISLKQKDLYSPSSFALSNNNSLLAFQCYRDASHTFPAVYCVDLLAEEISFNYICPGKDVTSMCWDQHADNLFLAQNDQIYACNMNTEKEVQVAEGYRVFCEQDGILYYVTYQNNAHVFYKLNLKKNTKTQAYRYSGSYWGVDWSPAEDWILITWLVSGWNIKTSQPYLIDVKTSRFYTLPECEFHTLARKAFVSSPTSSSKTATSSPTPPLPAPPASQPQNPSS